MAAFNLTDTYYYHSELDHDASLGNYSVESSTGTNLPLLYSPLTIRQYIDGSPH